VKKRKRERERDKDQTFWHNHRGAFEPLHSKGAYC